MAYVKVSTSKNAIACLRYGEHEKDCVKGGVDCPADTEAAIHQFAADRIMWNKDSGLQAHVIIQSFDGVEVAPEDANRLGQELAKKVAPGYRAMVYTHEGNEHTGTGNIHNHIVIESVRPSDGRKLDTHGFLQKSRNASDELAREAGLSVIQERGCAERYSHTEFLMQDEGRDSWKDTARSDIEEARGDARNEQEFKDEMKRRGYDVQERMIRGEMTWTYKVPNGRRVRASKLGDDYTRTAVCKDWDRERAQELARRAQRAREAALQKEREEQAARDREATEAAKKYLEGLRKGNPVPPPPMEDERDDGKKKQQGATLTRETSSAAASHEEETDIEIGWGR